MRAQYAFIDVETTGFDPIRNCVITLSCFVTDGDYQILGEHHGEFRPDGARDIVWSEGAEKVHGITWDRAMGFPDIETSSKAFLGFLDPFPPLIFVAHNAPFDKKMIKGTLARHDLHFNLYKIFPETHDTLVMVKEKNLTTGKSRGLGAICMELGIEHNHHDAKSDAFVLIELHRRLTGCGDTSTFTGLESPKEILYVES